VDDPGPGHSGDVQSRPTWSDRRRRTLLGLAAGLLVTGLGALVLPDEYGATAGILAALCAFLLVTAVVVFVVVPGPGTLGTLLRSVPLAGAVLVVAVLLLLSTSAGLRWLWVLTALGAAAWTASALWRGRRPEH
jgi:peptidoglycan/LPS O-acetylase OafA/YrhL